MNYPGASATYTIIVENAGSIDAKLESISGIDTTNSLEPTEIEYSINAVANDVLNAGSTNEYIVTVK